MTLPEHPKHSCFLGVFVKESFLLSFSFPQPPLPAHMAASCLPSEHAVVNDALLWSLLHVGGTYMLTESNTYPSLVNGTVLCYGHRKTTGKTAFFSWFICKLR